MVANPLVITPGGMTFAPGQTQSTNTNANPNAQMQLVGADSVPFSAQSNPSAPTKVTVTFPNLPKRNIANNPLSPLYSSSGNQTLQVGPNGYLLLLCFIQGAPGAAGTVVTATPQAITVGGVIVTGPHLGSENFQTFQAVVTIANSPLNQQVQGSVGAHLMLALG
jgi:hypothetical protein